MRFAFHFTGCAAIREGILWTRGQFGGFIDGLASRATQVDLLLDARDTAPETFESTTDYPVEAANVRWISLGPYTGPLAFWRRLYTLAAALPRHARQWDFVLLREPSRRSPWIRALIGRTPVVFLFGGDYHDWLDKTHQVSWTGHLRARLFTWSLRRAARSAIVFVNNPALFDRWQPYAPDLHLTQTTTLRQAVIHDPCTPRFAHEPPYRLLFIGRLTPLKGLEDLLAALAILNQESRQFILTVVGSGPAAYEQALKDTAAVLGIAPDITWQGFQPITRIWDFYRQADVYVLPTLSENVARTVWEAMSQNCPVVTTPVGGQARAFQDREDVVFCQPGSGRDLAEKITLVAQDEALRRRLQERGLALARANTIERRCQEILAIIEARLDARRRSPS